MFLIYQKLIRKRYQNEHNYSEKMHSYISFPSTLHQTVHRKNVHFSSIEIRSKKRTSKRRRYFGHRSYAEESTSKRRRFFAHWNYIKESMSKRRRFFLIEITSKKVCRNDVDFLPIEITYIKNVRRNDVEIYPCFIFDVSM